MLNWIVRNRTVWSFNCESIIDWCLIDLVEKCSNTWKHLTLLTYVQSQVESYQRLQKWYLIPPCLTLSIMRYVSRVKWSHPGEGVSPFPTPQCSSYWKGSLRVTFDYSCHLYFNYYTNKGIHEQGPTLRSAVSNREHWYCNASLWLLDKPEINYTQARCLFVYGPLQGVGYPWEWLS